MVEDGDVLGAVFIVARKMTKEKKNFFRVEGNSAKE